jgi:hypothetical protein
MHLKVIESGPAEAPGVSESGIGRKLLTAKDVADFFRIPRKKVYELGIPQVRVSERRVRWLESDVLAFARRSRVA